MMPERKAQIEESKMALPASRTELIEWSLRELGAPVLEINLDEDQIENRVDECLAYFRDYHFDGVEHAYVPHKITASKLTFAAPAGVFAGGEVLIGQTSGAKAIFIDQAQDNLSARFRYEPNSAPFQDGEVIQGEQSAATATLAPANSVLLGDLDNKFITVPDKVISVYNILTINQANTYSGNMFDVRYQFALNSMYNLLSSDLITYSMFKQHLNLWNFLFNGEKSIHYNRVTDRIYLDVDWINSLRVDSYIVFEGWVAVDPQAYPEVYGNLFVRKYCTALLKRQWGANLKKFSGIALPGGVTLNGQQIYDEADQEIKDLEKRIDREWQLPTNFFVG